MTFIKKVHTGTRIQIPLTNLSVQPLPGCLTPSRHLVYSVSISIYRLCNYLSNFCFDTSYFVHYIGQVALFH